MRKKKGVITSAKMKDTISVVVHRLIFHPIYKKRFRRSKKFLADTKGFSDLCEGDTVIIGECRPLSKRKCFRLLEVVSRVPRVSALQEEAGLEAAMRRRRKKDEETASPALQS
ncbi:MAG: uS17 family ribosomal protein [Candidatus Peregrinibacteria bacterium]